MGLGQNGHDFNVNGLVHIHGGTVTLPREVCTARNEGGKGYGTDNNRTGSVFAQSFKRLRSRSMSSRTR